jgi:hypothetical protein
MSQEHSAAKAKSGARAGGESSAEAVPHASNRAQVAQWRQEFRQLTGVDPADADAVKAWQSKHGVPVTGVVRSQTVAAARAAKAKEKEAKKRAPGAEGGESKDDFFEGEGVAEEGAIENPVLMDNIADGAVGSPKREEEKSSEGASHAGVAATDAKEGLGLSKGMEGGRLAEAEHESPWFKAAMAPAIVAQLHEGDYIGAMKTLAMTFSPSEYIEGLNLAAEKLGLHAAVKFFARYPALGLVSNVGLELVMWTYEGFSAIREAHEKGDRDSCISIYASAFADAFLYGEEGAGSNAGAVTDEQREAAERGRSDGAATAGHTGELAPVIGRELLKKHGGASGARKAIINELLKRAGISGVKV